MRNLNVPDATLAQSEAVRLAEQAAQALANADGKVDPATAVHAASDAARNLSDRLADRQAPQAQAAALARAERALNDPETRPDPAQATIRQKAIAAELAQLPLEDKAEATIRIERASELSDRAARIDDNQNASERPTAEALAEARNNAAEALDHLAARPAKPDPASQPASKAPPTIADPELPLSPTHIAAAKDLVRRQRQLRERVQAVLGRHVQPQQAIRREAVAIAGSLDELRDRIRPMSDRGPSTASEAAYHLRSYAAQSMDQATEHLAQGQAPYARDAQRRASDMVDRGAQLAADLAATLRADRQAAEARAKPLAGAPTTRIRRSARPAPRSSAPPGSSTRPATPTRPPGPSPPPASRCARRPATSSPRRRPPHPGSRALPRGRRDGRRRV